MKILLTAINAKYIHSNLAIYSLKAYAKEYKNNIKLIEFTINNYLDDCLQAIYKEKPDFIGFSCYIWNISMVEQLCTELRKVMPDVKIWLGGPEVSYDAKERLLKSDNIDGIMIGEGEETFNELLDYYIADKLSLDRIKGIAYCETAYVKPLSEKKVSNESSTESKDKSVLINEPRQGMDISSLPFPYEDMKDLDNKIIYYESSRGCPYSCSYCLSSTSKNVRLRSMECVKRDLSIFIKAKVPQVKFVDRTFNCNKTHAMAIWQFIKENDNGITNFHFEISADILDEEELALLGSLREGLVQLEIGVQSTNSDTIKAIHRSMNLNKLGVAVNRIHEGKNIHEHLDLIAGLPYEDYESFKKSFNEVYALKPNQLQLGFLKVLKGSAMYEASKEYGIIYKDVPPYEVLYTKWLSYDDVLELKKVEDMVEVYYNSGQFVYSIRYMEHFYSSPFDLYKGLGDYYEKYKLNENNHSRIRRYEILIDFMKEQKEYDNESFQSMDMDAFKSILVHDLYLREKLKKRVAFAEDASAYKKFFYEFYKDDGNLRKYFEINEDGEAKTEENLKQYLHMEHYSIDVYKTALTGITAPADQFILYNYKDRNPLDYQAKTILLPKGD